MARPPRRIVMNIFRNFLDSLKPRYSKADLVGVDKLGNKYYEAKKTEQVTRRKQSRYYLPHGGEEDFEQELPAEWEAWLRGRRKEPPTVEEIEKNDAIATQKKENAKQLQLDKPETKTVGLPIEPGGYDSFPKYEGEFEVRPGIKGRKS